MTVPEGYTFKGGTLWPADDEDTRWTLILQMADIDAVYRWCSAFRVVVQAGGNCGLWPKALGERFEIVYTFEPDPVCFRCLCANAPATNIFKINAALGNDRGCIDLQRNPKRIGSHHVDGAGPIPTFRVDDLALSVCDLIYLDVEGFEKFALLGAADTIGRCRPVIALEDRHSSERYGVPKGGAVEWIVNSFNYRIAERMRGDVVLVPA